MFDLHLGAHLSVRLPQVYELVIAYLVLLFHHRVDRHLHVPDGVLSGVHILIVEPVGLAAEDEQHRGETQYPY